MFQIISNVINHFFSSSTKFRIIHARYWWAWRQFNWQIFVSFIGRTRSTKDKILSRNNRQMFNDHFLLKHRREIGRWCGELLWDEIESETCVTSSILFILIDVTSARAWEREREEMISLMKNRLLPHLDFDQSYFLLLLISLGAF